MAINTLWYISDAGCAHLLTHDWDFRKIDSILPEEWSVEAGVLLAYRSVEEALAFCYGYSAGGGGVVVRPYPYKRDNVEALTIATS